MDKLKKHNIATKNEQIFDRGGVKQVQEKIVEMVRQIDDKKYLKMIYGFVNRLHKK